MASAALHIKMGALPHSDGSGDRVTAEIKRNDEGAVVLSVDDIFQISLDEWPAVREAIDRLVYAADRLASCPAQSAALPHPNQTEPGK